MKTIFSDIPTTVMVLGTLFAIVTLVIGVLEYRKKNMLTRIELYLQMRDYYARDKNLKQVCQALGDGDTPISALTYEQKRQFLGTMESVALLVNSKVMNDHVAMYMFGYYAIAAWESDEFWNHGNLKREDPMWALFKQFCLTNIKIKNKFNKNPINGVKKNLNFLPKF